LWASLERSKYSHFFSVFNFSSTQIKHHIVMLDIRTMDADVGFKCLIVQILCFFLPLFHNLIWASGSGYFLVFLVSSSCVPYLSFHDVQIAKQTIYLTICIFYFILLSWRFPNIAVLYNLYIIVVHASGIMKINLI